LAIATTLTINAYPGTYPACQVLTPPTGTLTETIGGAPVAGELIIFSYGATPIGSDTTDAFGTYVIPQQLYVEHPADVIQLGAGTFTVDFTGTAGHDPSTANTGINFVFCEGDANLTSGFFVSHFRTPARIKIDAGVRLWGGVICIDPNGLRADQKGPHYFLLDSMTVRPGLSDKAGAFEFTINDQKTSIDLDGNQKREYDMVLIQDGTPYIRDNDEFWIGVQQGPEAPNNTDGLNYGWTAGGAGGREWLMGGWITKRYYVYDLDSRITAIIEGRCYMDLWRKSPFGTPEIPRDYSSGTGTDFANIAANILTDVNARQDADYQFSQSGVYWPGAPIGLEWTKEFKEDSSFKVMQDGCDEAGWEWQIVVNAAGATPAARREVRLFKRTLAPISGQQLIEFDRNIRSAPRIIMGDTTQLISGVIVTGLLSTVPPDVSGWIQMGLWPDIAYTNREYTMLSIPFPPNSARIGSGGEFADASLVIDDEGFGAINFQKTELGNGEFYLVFNYYTDDSGQPKATRMSLDLRRWRRLKFKFKHNTRTAPDTTRYRISIHSTGIPAGQFLNSKYFYDFGEGNKQDLPGYVEPSGNINTPQVSDHDTISDTEWTEIDLLLPEVAQDGSIAQNALGQDLLHGWTAVTGGGAPDLMAIDFISLHITPSETEPGNLYAASPPTPPALTTRRFIHRIALNTNIPAATRYLTINNPENFFGRGTGAFPLGISGEAMFYNPQPFCLIGGQTGAGWRHEPAYIAGINGSDYPTPAYPASGGKATVRLTDPILNTYTGNTYLYIIGGWSISFSQMHLEMNVLLEKGAASVPVHLQNPKRYRVVDYQEIEYGNEAEARADQDLLEMGISRQSVRVRVDGDPRQRIGMRVTPRFDPARSAAGEPNMIFQDVSMFIDDAEYRLVGTNFFSIFLLGLTSQTRSIGIDDSATEVIAISKDHDKILQNARGTTPLTRGIAQKRDPT